MAGKLYVANRSAVVFLDGTRYVLQKGVTRVREGHELLKDGRDSMFDPITADYEVEEARAKPGRPRKYAPDKPPPPPFPPKPVEPTE